MKRRFIFVAIYLLICVACKKIEFNKYKGTYDLNHFSETWETGKPTEYIIEDKSIEIFRNSNYIDVVGKLIHIDSLEPGEEFRSGSATNYYTVKFIEDSLYYYTYNETATGGKINRYVGKRTSKK